MTGGLGGTCGLGPWGQINAIGPRQEGLEGLYLHLMSLSHFFIFLGELGLI